MLIFQARVNTYWIFDGGFVIHVIRDRVKSEPLDHVQRITVEIAGAVEQISMTLKPVLSTTSVKPSQCPLAVPIQVSTEASNGLPILITRFVHLYGILVRHQDDV